MDLVPVGHELGVFHDGSGAAPTRGVRVGASVEALTDEQYAAWRAPSGADSAVVDDLVARRLLAHTADQVAFAERHRLLPLALGLGSTVEEPWLFSVGLLYQPLVAMTGPLYDLWQWAHLSPDLWSACREAAAIAVRAGIEEEEQTDPAAVLAGAMETLPQLLLARVACFDVRTGGRP